MSSIKAIETIEPIEVFIGLGSNQDSPQERLVGAVEELSASLELSRLSSWYWSRPFEAPAQANFLNAVAAFRVELDPESLLSLCHGIELTHGRRRDTFRGPRSLDLDILLYGGMVVTTPKLTIPHVDLHRRRFVLDPMAEIAPDVEHPGFRRTISELRGQCPDDGSVYRIEGTTRWKELAASLQTVAGKAESVV